LLLKSEELIGKFNAEAKFEIFTNIKAGQELDANSKIWLNFYSSSFIFYADFQPVTTEYDGFAKLMVVFSVLFLVSAIFFKPKRSVYNLSEWMIVQVAAFILTTNFILFSEGLVRLDTNLWVVAVCALFNIALSLFFLRNYEDVVWNEFKYKAKAVFLIIYLIIYFTLVFLYWKSQIFWIYETFILFATQISYAYSKGGKGGMAIKLVLTIIFTRVPFIYYRYNFEELTRRQNSPLLLVAFIGINIILLTFIALQRYFGSRFLIPKELIPDYFNYFQKEIDVDVLK
jgi:hypothetical protein